MVREKIPIIYILSTGRSGSTLLDLLLGAHPQVWTIGEVHNIPWELRDPQKPCGCRTPVADCNFWREVVSKVPLMLGDYPIDYFREKNRSGRAVRWPHMLNLVKGKVGGKWHQAAEEYGYRNAQLFQTILQMAEEYKSNSIFWLVDASKDPYRLLWLQSSGLFDLRVIHLVKDPRAFVFSMTKNNLPKGKKKGF